MFLKHVYRYICFTWLLLMLMFPSDLQVIKYILLIIVCVFSAFDFIINKKKISRKIIFGMLIWNIYFVSSLALGIINGFKVDYSLINIYFVTPVIAVLLSTIVDNKNKIKKLNDYLIWITFAIVVLDFFYILDRMAIISIPFSLDSSIFGSVFVSDSKLEFRITNQSSLIFLLPYCINLFIVKGGQIKENKKILITIFLGIIVTLMSGRRTFQIIVLLSAILSYCLNLFVKKKNIFSGWKTKYIFFIPVLSYILILLIEKITGLENVLTSFWQTFSSAFDFSSGSGAIRVTQNSALITGWEQSPMFGHGLNSHDKIIVRSSVTPWSYEMVYTALLFQTGLFGIMIFFGTIISIFRKNLIKAIHLETEYSIYFLSISVSFISFVIAGASNPMVYYVWVWAIALIAYQDIK